MAKIIVNNSALVNVTDKFIKGYCAKSLSVHKVPQIIEFKDKMLINYRVRKVKQNFINA